MRWKAKVVDEDPEDRGIRAILNYGHTIAHAIEATAGYGAYRHGEAVAIGMVGAGRLAQRSGRWPAADLTRQNNLLAAIGLPAVLHRRRPHPGPRRHAPRQKSPERPSSAGSSPPPSAKPPSTSNSTPP